MDIRLLDLCREHTCFDEIHNKRIIEIGSLDVNGSFRDILSQYGTSEYIGIDLEIGVGVDKVLKIEDCLNEYGPESFDVVVSTETLEHVEDWRTAINNIKSITKIGGFVLLTSRSKGFGMHAYPHDHWRYEISDIEEIFSNWDIQVLEKDNWRGDHFGFFLKATKTTNDLIPLNHMALYNIYTDPRHNPARSHLRRILHEQQLLSIERDENYATILNNHDQAYLKIFTPLATSIEGLDEFLNLTG